MPKSAPAGGSSHHKSWFSSWEKKPVPHPPPSYPHKAESGEGGGSGDGGGGERARSLLVNQSWFPRWSCSRRFDFPPLLPLLCSPTSPAPGFQFHPEKHWGLLSNPPSSSNSQQQLKLQERASSEGRGQGDPLALRQRREILGERRERSRNRELGDAPSQMEASDRN